jgi:hypothetical protein
MLSTKKSKTFLWLWCNFFANIMRQETKWTKRIFLLSKIKIKYTLRNELLPSLHAWGAVARYTINCSANWNNAVISLNFKDKFLYGKMKTNIKHFQPAMWIIQYRCCCQTSAFIADSLILHLKCSTNAYEVIRLRHLIKHHL